MALYWARIRLIYMHAEEPLDKHLSVPSRDKKPCSSDVQRRSRFWCQMWTDSERKEDISADQRVRPGNHYRNTSDIWCVGTHTHTFKESVCERGDKRWHVKKKKKKGGEREQTEREDRDPPV